MPPEQPTAMNVMNVASCVVLMPLAISFAFAQKVLECMYMYMYTYIYKYII